MNRYALCFVLLAALGVVPAPAGAAHAAVVGTWEGLIEVDRGKVEVDFQLLLSSLEKGEIWFPTQGPARHPLTKLELNGTKIAFSTVDSAGIVSSFTGEVAGDAIRGDISEQGMVRPFRLRRISIEPVVVPPEGPELAVLSPDGKALREAFNLDGDKVRLVAILSPTCGVCRMGARMVENYLFDRFEDPRLKVFVVWEPRGEEDDERAAKDATFFLESERATHFWSAERFAGKSFQQPLALKFPAWDVYLVFPPGATWGDDVPTASFYMHNLGSALPAENLFDAAALATKVDQLLADGEKNPSGRPTSAASSTHSETPERR